MFLLIVYLLLILSADWTTYFRNELFVLDFQYIYISFLGFLHSTNKLSRDVLILSKAWYHYSWPKNHHPPIIRFSISLIALVEILCALEKKKTRVLNETHQKLQVRSLMFKTGTLVDIVLKEQLPTQNHQLYILAIYTQCHAVMRWLLWVVMGLSALQHHCCRICKVVKHTHTVFYIRQTENARAEKKTIVLSPIIDVKVERFEIAHPI